MVKRHNVLTGLDASAGDEVSRLLQLLWLHLSSSSLQVASNDEFIASKTAMIVYRAAVAAVPGVLLSS